MEEGEEGVGVEAGRELTSNYQAPTYLILKLARNQGLVRCKSSGKRACDVGFIG